MSYSLPSWDLFDNSNTFYENRPLVTNISCTVVIKLTTSHYGAVSSSQNASTVCSTNLFAIAVPHFYLINRHDGATSIMANSLICTLREYISQPTGPRLRPLFKDSIQGLSPTGTIISLATTRIPEFGDEMEGPHTGYQALSTDATSSPTMQTGGTLFDPNQEIMSMASVSSSNSAKLADFTRVWQTLLQPSRHFFLIFQIDSFPPSDLIFRITPSTNGLMASQHPISTPPASVASSGSSFENQLLTALGPSFTPQQMKDAVSLKDQPLFQNYKNWLAMARLLDSEVINLPGFGGDVTTANFSANEIAEILRYFNWAPTSYYKKRRLFLWANSAARMSWSGPTGTGIYHTWRAIAYLWGRGGAFERNRKPEKQSNNLDEIYASRLTQDAIEKKKSDISRHILEV